MLIFWTMKVLFMCVANSARSQIAEGIARNIWADRCEVASAGSKPSGRVNPLAIIALQKRGIDISQHRSKSWTELPKEFLSSLDFLITLCAEEECPHIPSKAKRLSWAMPDPANSQEAFDSVADKIMKIASEFGQENGLVKS